MYKLPYILFKNISKISNIIKFYTLKKLSRNMCKISKKLNKTLKHKKNKFNVLFLKNLRKILFRMPMFKKLKLKKKKIIRIKHKKVLKKIILKNKLVNKNKLTKKKNSKFVIKTNLLTKAM